MPDEKDYWPEFENALPALAGEMPQEVASMANRQIRPMSAIEKALLARGAAAITHPTGTIAYNREMAEAAVMKPEDILAHELTHIRQLNKRGFLGQLFQMLAQSQPYGERPDEVEAFAQERSRFGRRRRETDIRLPAPRQEIKER